MGLTKKEIQMIMVQCGMVARRTAPAPVTHASCDVACRVCRCSQSRRTASSPTPSALFPTLPSLPVAASWP